MRFFTMYKPADCSDTFTPPSEEHMAEMGAFAEEMTKAGVLISSGGLFPTSQGALVRQSKGEVSVVRGPFGAGQEHVGGWAELKVESLEAAIELNKRFLSIAGDGETEIREIVEFMDCGSVDAVASVAATYIA